MELLCILFPISYFSFQLAASSDPILYESFDVSFQGKWIVSEKEEYQGEWKHAKSEGHDDYGLLASEANKKYAIVTELEKPLKLNDYETIVLQFEARFQEGLNCGGSYLKYLIPQEEDWEAKDFDNEAPYVIMFGPDKCGLTDQVHFIVNHKNPKSGELVERRLTLPPSVPSDRFTHVYTAIIKPNTNELRILIDGEEKRKANFLSEEDFEPSFIPAKTIQDPEDEKPEDWDERVQIPDPDSVKPEDWGDDMEIEDEEAAKPEDWLENEPEEIIDPEATKPEEWDDDVDGDWEPNLIENPNCATVSGCGEWKRPMKKNPNYKGKWEAPLIENPNYKGVWEPKEILNPDYYELDRVEFDSITGIGIEIMTMQSGIIFDNVLIAGDEEVAESYRAMTGQPKFEAEKKQKEKDEYGPWDNPTAGLCELLGKFVFRQLYKVAGWSFLSDYSRERFAARIRKAERYPNLTGAIYFTTTIIIPLTVFMILFLIYMDDEPKKKPATSNTKKIAGKSNTAGTSNTTVAEGSSSQKTIEGNSDQNNGKEGTAARPRRRNKRKN